MTRSIRTAAVIALILGTGAGVSAKPLTYALPEEGAQLKPAHGPAFEAAQNNCLSCHSADYVNSQPPKRGRAFWEAEVTKMIKVYHAPIDEADAKLIAEYLAQAY